VILTAADTALAEAVVWRGLARDFLADRGIYDPSGDLVDYVAEELWTQGVIDVRN
jgi:hypothetical protein